MNSVAMLLITSAVALPSGFDPPEVWHHFDKILEIPRCSGEEQAIRSYVKQVASRHGLGVVEDSSRNLIVKRPASGAGTQATKPIILQTHLDMVCEKNTASTHDWTRDPIFASVHDGWLIANETTLGSDNGIGVAMSLSFMESASDAVLPPLEFVFTVEEETGLFGATGLDVSKLEGRHLLNFDSEEFGVVYIGCAGGADAIIQMPVDSMPLARPSLPFRLELTGLRGGHSGADIHEGRANALILIARAIFQIQLSFPTVRLLDLEGGNKDNAIPRESFAALGLDPVVLPQVRNHVAAIEANLTKEFGRIDPGLSIRISDLPMESFVVPPLSEGSGQRLLDLLLALPSGPIKMSHEVADLVETSNNIAKVRRDSDSMMQVLCFPRSSIDSALEDAHFRIQRIARLCGATVARTFSFPGWAPNASQALLSVVVDEFTRDVGSKPQVSAIHAGLECGIIGGKIPGVEMVSFGPDIKGAHAPGERVNMVSVQRTWHVAKQVLKRLAMADDIKDLKSEL